LSLRGSQSTLLLSLVLLSQARSHLSLVLLSQARPHLSLVLLSQALRPTPPSPSLDTQLLQLLARGPAESGGLRGSGPWGIRTREGTETEEEEEVQRSRPMAHRSLHLRQERGEEGGEAGGRKEALLSMAGGLQAFSREKGGFGFRFGRKRQSGGGGGRRGERGGAQKGGEGACD